MYTLNITVLNEKKTNRQKKRNTEKKPDFFYTKLTIIKNRRSTNCMLSRSPVGKVVA